MAESADAAGYAVGNFVGAGVAENSFAVVNRAFGNFEAVGPYGVGRAAVGFALAGVDYVDVVDAAVVVEVVLREVDLVGEGFCGLEHHFFGAEVIAVVVVAAVVRHVVLHRHGAVYVELGVEVAVALCQEVVACGASAGVVGEALLVEHAVEEVVGVWCAELHVLVFHQEYEAFYFALSGVVGCEEAEAGVFVGGVGSLGVGFCGSLGGNARGADAAYVEGACREGVAQ